MADSMTMGKQWAKITVNGGDFDKKGSEEYNDPVMSVWLLRQCPDFKQ